MGAASVGELAETRLEERREAGTAFFGEQAMRLAELCHRMAERFARGGRLVAIGTEPAARSDVRHVTVEFVHPVIVGKRALPALGLTGDGAGLERELALALGADDIVMAFGEPDPEPGLLERALGLARAAGALTVAFAPLGAEVELEPQAEDPFVRQELVETAYHVLWELVHVFFEHRGLLQGRTERRVHDVGASSFLYPFLSEDESDLDAVLADVAASAQEKFSVVVGLRAATLAAGQGALAAAAAALRDGLDAGGRLLALGNGGSATDATDVVADFLCPPAQCGWPGRAALDLTADSAILTALANDIGSEAIFARQIIAHGQPGDTVLALSTSGNSLSVLDALAQARRMGLQTIALVGYDGGRVAAEELADHVIVSPSQYIPRIQEAQATVYHLLRELVEREQGVSTLAGARGVVRLRVRVRGTVQGVGFRPFVYRLAQEGTLAGWVLNDEHGVLLEIEGETAAVQRFLERLRTQAPPLAVIEQIVRDAVAVRGEDGFRILESARGDPSAAPPVAPDCAPCADCLRELRDRTDRRHRYPFINCTNCGPRFTIVTGVPYDRPLTTMAKFTMCADCAREYRDPSDRRFHAQPNACGRCGPRLRLVGRDGTPITEFAPHPPARDAVEVVAHRLLCGAIVAVKSVGGFHLACDAQSERAVAALRARKHREDKPFALLAGSLAAARALVTLTAEDEALLTGVARPIVLAPRRSEGPDCVQVASSVAPGLPELGVMLPSAPLHELLIDDLARLSGDPWRPLVMTSGNLSDDPIAFTDQDALQRLGSIADLFLLHDRGIETRTDDSVQRTVTLPGGRRPLMLRRSRGYVPAAIALPVPAARPLLACGAEQKSTFCLAGGAHAWVGHHIGDLEHYATLLAFQDGIRHFERLFALAPVRVAHDLHPGYLSTQYALERDAAEHVAVQHHHAHLAACLAEHGVSGPAVGAIYDGTGLGSDGTVWGGELLVGGLDGFERAGHLRTVRLPGGAAAVRQPWRMAAAWLDDAFGEQRPLPGRLRGAVSEQRWQAVRAVAADGRLSPLTSSAGRLLDGIGALCGLGAEVSYEGQTAISLEAAAWQAAEVAAFELELVQRDGVLVLDPRALIRALAVGLERGADIPALAAGVHEALARATAQALERTARAAGVGTAVLSGGVFQNRWLLQSVAERLHRAGLRVLVPELLPPNDGGVSFGQAAVAAACDPR